MSMDRWTISRYRNSFLFRNIPFPFPASLWDCRTTRWHRRKLLASFPLRCHILPNTEQKIKERFRFHHPSFSVYRSYLGRPFRVEPRRSLLHTNVRNTRRGFAHFLRFGFIERGTDTSRRDASHCSIPNSHPTRRRTLKS